MEQQTTISEFVEVDRDFTDYDDIDIDTADIWKYLHIQATITNRELRISVGYTSSIDPSVWIRTIDMNFIDGVIPLTAYNEWESDVKSGLYQSGMSGMHLNMLSAFNNVMLKSMKVYAMYKQDML